MADVLEASALDRWQEQPILFIEQILRNPETGRPFELLEAEHQSWRVPTKRMKVVALFIRSNYTLVRKSRAKQASLPCIC